MVTVSQEITMHSLPASVKMAINNSFVSIDISCKVAAKSIIPKNKESHVRVAHVSSLEANGILLVFLMATHVAMLLCRTINENVRNEYFKTSF
jgi:hypothetical protein